MDDAIPEVIELAFDKLTEYVQIDNIPFAPGHVKSKLKTFFSGWHVSVATSAFIAFSVLLVNLVLIIWASTRNLSPIVDGIIVLFSGECSQMQTIFTWTHVGINILSTLLLAASNTSCQVLSAPTRAELDAAHRDGHWLDIGVSSFRNLRFIAVKRLIVYVILLLSSVPLHLIYNSVLFPTTTTHENLVVLTNRGFFEGATWNVLSLNFKHSHKRPVKLIDAVGKLQDRAMSHELVKLSITECLAQFGSQYIGSYRNFVLETTASEKTPTIRWITEKHAMSQDMTWLCDGRSRFVVAGNNHTARDYICPRGLDYVKANPDKWEMSPQSVHDNFGSTLKVVGCYAEPVTPACTVSLSRSLLIVVIGCNFLKLACFLLVVRWADGRPLVTIGDAIDSFLRKPDPLTVDLGPISAVDVRKGVWNPKNEYLKRSWTVKPWLQEQRFWFAALGWKRWSMIGFIFFLLYLPAASLPYWAFMADGSWGNISNMGNVEPDLIITISTGWTIPAEVIFVNLPQLILSFVYVFYNNTLTTMLQAAECANYSKHRKGLRVTSETRFQRSTYWLQVPYRYAIPQMIVWIVLHWLVSQSIFLARVTILPFADGGQIQTLNGCGFSQSPVLMVIVLAGVMAVAQCILGFRRYPSNIPLMGSCSVAIAAACHASESEGEEIAALPLQYGVLKNWTVDGLVKFRRVGFSALEVEPLEKGEIYR